MQAPSPLTDIVHFGIFQLDLKARELHKAGVKFRLHGYDSQPCCDDMRRQLEFRCADHADLSDCPDSLVVLLENPARFGIRVHDSGSSCAGMRYFPWCGTNLSA